RFGAAIDEIETLLPPGAPKSGVAVCAQLDDSDRTLAAIAGRAYNGRAMLEVRSRTSVALEQASLDIDAAICLRQKANLTGSQVGGSGENRAVIDYNRAIPAGESKSNAEASRLFANAYCAADSAIEKNSHLAWSWTIIYLLDTASGVRIYGK